MTDRHPMHEAHRLRQMRGTTPRPPIHDNSWMQQVREDVDQGWRDADAAAERVREAQEELRKAEALRYLRQAERATRSAKRWDDFAKFTVFLMFSPVATIVLGALFYCTLKMLE